MVEKEPVGREELRDRVLAQLYIQEAVAVHQKTPLTAVVVVEAPEPAPTGKPVETAVLQQGQVARRLPAEAPEAPDPAVRGPAPQVDHPAAAAAAAGHRAVKKPAPAGPGGR